MVYMFHFDMLEIKELMNLKSIYFHLYYLNINILVDIKVIDMTFSGCILRIPLGGMVSQNFH